MNTKFGIISGSTVAALTLGSMNIVHASTATLNVNVNLPVAAPTCSLSNSPDTEVNLPEATSSETWQQYVTAQTSFINSSAYGGGWKTAPSLQVTTTITCSVPNTPITSFLVAPAAGSVLAPSIGPDFAYMVDSAGNKGANGTLAVGYEQVSINGNAVGWGYNSGAYGTTFFTSTQADQQSWTASVIWRPTVSATGGNLMNAAAGNSYSSTATVTANY